jgi:uncharacterized protein YndB with AHSA1/START domain
MSDEPAGQQLVYDFELDAPPEKVWRALSIPALLEHWLLPVANGNGLAFSGGAAGLGERIEAEVLEAEPPRYLRWRWQESGAETGSVSFTLAPGAAGGTILHVVHERRVRVPMQPAANSNPVTMLLAA